MYNCMQVSISAIEDSFREYRGVSRHNDRGVFKHNRKRGERERERERLKEFEKN